jgi:hypothetical protein
MKLNRLLIVMGLVLALTALTLMAVSAGVACEGSIGGTVWCDADCDGDLDADEAGIEGVKVTLEHPWGYTTETHTDANGKYEFAALEVAPGVFEGLCADDYTVTVDPSTVAGHLHATFDYDGIETPHTAEVTLPYYDSVVDNVDFGYGCVCAFGGQGCTPGYWKQKQHFDSWVKYIPEPSPEDPEELYMYNKVFDVDYVKTLLEALKTGGGDEKALGRHATAALLNAANPDVNYFYTVYEIINMVQQAYDTDDFEGVKNLFEAENERGCPLD